MKTIYDIFSKSPFGLLNDHISKISECLDLVPEMIQSLIEKEYESVNKIGKEISKREHEADIIKDTIRSHLPKSIFMPVSREDMLKLLHRQDNIADHCEDLAVLISVRKAEIIDELKVDFKSFVAKAIKAAKETVDLIQKMHGLMESSFSGPQAEDVLTQIENVGQLEWETDKKKYELVKKMFELDNKIDPVSQIMFLKIFDEISSIADSAENTANALRLMISK